MRKAALGVVAVLATAALAFLTTPQRVYAGGWVLVTMDAMPAEFLAGEPTALGMMVRQHGQNPVSGQAPKLQFTDPASGESFAVTAKDEGPTGHYVALVTLPRAGAWEWQVEVWGIHKMPAIQAVVASIRPAAANPPAEQVLPALAESAVSEPAATLALPDVTLPVGSVGLLAAALALLTLGRRRLPGWR